MTELFDGSVGLVRSTDLNYSTSEILQMLRKVCDSLGWSDHRSALGNIVPRGSKIVIKPNLVLHENEGGGSLLPLITHPSLIKAVATEALRAEPETVLVGDAPIQKCKFQQLLRSAGLDVWATDLAKRDPRFKGVKDFRRTTCESVFGVRVARENLQPENEFVRFDLGKDSLLEPISEKEGSFRVAAYDPRLLARTHKRGTHQFLISRDVMEADVVINLPKLKTHKKAGITCALKNTVGINGNKEYLPHHRIGGSDDGGDCYPGKSRAKRFLEYALDREVLASSYRTAAFWRSSVIAARLISRLQGDQVDASGSWSGNDTIWRTCIDLNRILLYGKADGAMSDHVCRTVIHISDAIMAGQGDGPLASGNLPMGLILASRNAAAMDWVGAHLLQYAPEKIPIVQRAFGDFKWRIACFKPDEIRLLGDLSRASTSDLSRQIPGLVEHPFGWRGTRARITVPGMEQRSDSGSDYVYSGGC